jgi:uncharacterized membrane protein
MNLEWLAIPAFVLLIGYQLWITFRIKGNPEKTTFGRLQKARAEWFSAHAGKNAILIVQTLRNSVMSATFLASTALFVSVGIVGFTLESSSISLSFITPVSQALMEIKLLTMSGLMFFVFFNFALSLRAFNHTGFLAGLEDQSCRAMGIKTLAQAARHYTMGMRGYYSIVPLLFWLVGGPYFLGVVIALILFLVYLDH